MDKNKALKVLNPVLALLLVCQAGSGLFHDALPYEMFGALHTACGALLSLAAALHLYLNRAWVRSAYLPAGKPD